MSEGFGTLALVCALVGPTPPIQRPKSVPSPVQRPQKPAAPERAPEPARRPEPPPPTEPAPPPAPSPPPISDSDKAAELDELTDILEPLPSAPEPESEPEPEPPSRVPAPRRLDRAELVRRGVTIAPAVGATLCGHDWCDAYRGGFGGQLELGFRFGVVMPHVSVDGGSGSDDTSILEEQLALPYDTIRSAHTTFFGVGGGLSVFFKQTGLLDPYVSARLGYNRTTSHFKIGGGAYKETVSRGSVRLGGGLDVFIGRNVAIGPRFDVTVGFAGEVCAEVEVGGLPSGSPSQVCYDVRNIEETARIYAQELPVPLFLGGQLRVTIPRPR